MRIGVLLAVAMIAVVATQGNSRRDRFKPNGVVDNEGPANGGQNPTEAPAGFDNQTNGMDSQGPDYETLNEDTVVPLRSFNDNRFVFEEIETAGDGVGPPTTRSPAASAIRTSSLVGRARWPNTARDIS